MGVGAKVKIVFLDFDGVLNSTRYITRIRRDGAEVGEEHDLDRVPVARLDVLCRLTGAKVVVSSSWRHGRTVGQLSVLLAKRGLSASVIDKTIDFVPNQDPLSKRDCGQRGDEIRHWLEQNKRLRVSRWCVLDDSDDMDAVRDRFVRTDMHVGLTVEDVARCFELLGGTRVPK